jgi:hypothetical protein
MSRKTKAATAASFSIMKPLQGRVMAKTLLKTNKTDDQDAQTYDLIRVQNAG